MLPVSHTSTSVDTQTLLSGFNAPTRRNLQLSLIGLGQGFLGRGQGINETLPIAAPVLSHLQALSSAGFTQFANLKAIYLLRVQGGKQTKIPFNYKETIKGRGTQQNITLKPGDTIVVP